MDWNAVAAYNLGTGLDGLVMMAAGLVAIRGALDTHGRVRGLVVIAIGMYIATRGLHWYVADLPGLSVPGDGAIYAPWAASSRYFLTPFAVLMSVGLATLYGMQGWRISRPLAVTVVFVTLIGYVIGGLTPEVPP